MADFMSITIDVPAGNTAAPPLSPRGGASATLGAPVPEKRKRRGSFANKSPANGALNPGKAPAGMLGGSLGVPGTAPPGGQQKKGRARGMSAVKKFEQEYVAKESSGFLANYAKKAEAPKTTGVKGPLPNVVDLFAQVSKLKEEALEAKTSETTINQDNSELRSQVRELRRLVEFRDTQLLKDVQSSEARCRDTIHSAWMTVHMQLAKMFDRLEPEDELLNTISEFTGTTNGREQALAEQLLFEVTRRQELEARLLQGTEESQATLLCDELKKQRDELISGRKRVREAEETLVVRERQVAELSMEKAEVEAALSKVETEMTVIEGEARRTRVNADTLAVAVDQKVAELREVEEENSNLRDRLRAAKERVAEAESSAMSIPRLDSEIKMIRGMSTNSLSPSPSRLTRGQSLRSVSPSGEKSPRKVVRLGSAMMSSPRRVQSQMVTPRSGQELSMKRLSSLSPPRSGRY